MKERQCDQLIDYFNNQLTEEEKLAYEEHLRNCESCQEELNELRELIDDLPFLSDSVEPPQGMRDRVLASVFNETGKDQNETSAFEGEASEKGGISPIQTNEKSTKQEAPVYSKDESSEMHGTPSASKTETSKKHDPSISYKRRKNPAVIYGSLAAALLLSVIGNGYLWNETRELESQNQQVAMEHDILESDYNRLESDYNQLLAEGEEGDGVYDVLRTSNLASTEAEEDWQGQATIIAENGNVDLVIQVTGLPALTGTETFQAWIFDGETPLPAGNFNIDEDGNGAVKFRISDMEDSQIDQIAITLEPQPYNEEPEGQIVLASQ